MSTWEARGSRGDQPSFAPPAFAPDRFRVPFLLDELDGLLGWCCKGDRVLSDPTLSWADRQSRDASGKNQREDARRESTPKKRCLMRGSVPELGRTRSVRRA